MRGLGEDDGLRIMYFHKTSSLSGNARGALTRSGSAIDENAIIDDSAIMPEQAPMTSITIRNLEPGLKERLRVRAAEQGHSMEAEARRILRGALNSSSPSTGLELYDSIHERFAAIGGVDLELPPRDEPGREPPDFD